MGARKKSPMTAPEHECSCAACRDMCKRPCWPTPTEAAKLIDLGYGPKLMADWWCGDPANNDDNGDDRTYILCGANPGCEGDNADEDEDLGIMAMFRVPALFKGCAFHKSDGKCELHGVCKPIEGRLAIHDHPRDAAQQLHREIAKTWATDEGRALVARWRAEVGL